MGKGKWERLSCVFCFRAWKEMGIGTKGTERRSVGILSSFRAEVAVRKQRNPARGGAQIQQ